MTGSGPAPARFTLDDPPFAARTGRGVTIAVIDSGIHPANPHIGTAVSGVCIGGDGAEGDDFLDRVGHGTAVAAAIHEKAPGAELVAVRVFDRTLATSAEVLARAIERAASRGADLINLSLGTGNPARREMLAAAVAFAAARSAIIVSARESNGVSWLPGSLVGVVGVTLDWQCDRQSIEVSYGAGDGGLVVAASGYPRPIPGVPVERNLSGISFAVANVTGFLARLLEDTTAARDLAAVTERLRAAR